MYYDILKASWRYSVTSYTYKMDLLHSNMTSRNIQPAKVDELLFHWRRQLWARAP